MYRDYCSNTIIIANVNQMFSFCYLYLTQDKTTHLQGELAENHRVSEANRDNLVAAIVQRRLAEKERDEFEVKFQQAFRQIGNLKSEVDEAKKQLKDLEVRKDGELLTKTEPLSYK